MNVRRWAVAGAIVLAGCVVQVARPVAASQPVDVVELDVWADALVYEPHSGILFASERGDGGSDPGHHVVPIDPINHTVGTPIAVGDDPGPLAVSSDGRYLYVGVDGQVVQIDVASRTVSARWDIGLGGWDTGAAAIAVMPGTNDTIVVSHRYIGLSPSLAGIGVYDAGVRRPALTPSHTGPNWFSFTTPDHLVGYANDYGDRARLYQIAVQPDGLHVLGESTVPTPAGTTFGARAAGGRVFAGTRVLDGATGALLATLPDYSVTTVPDLDRDRLLALRQYPFDDRHLGTVLDVYDATSYALVDSFDLGPTQHFPYPSNVWDVAVLDGGIVAVATSMEVKLFDARPVRGASGEYTPLTPSRVLDTRIGVGAGGSIGPVGPGGTRDVQIAGVGGVPATGVDSVVLNATVAAPTESSYLTVWPTGGPQPDSSNLNFAATETRANLVTVPVGAGGRISLFNERGDAHVIFDVVGFYATSDGPTGSRFRPLSPQRLFDTRGGAPVGPGGVFQFDVTGAGGVPDAGVTAVAMNVTAVNATANSYVTVWPDDSAQPNASNINFPSGATVPNLVIMRVPPSGLIDFFNESGDVHLLADVVGYYTSDRGGEGGRFVSAWPARFIDTRVDSPFDSPGKLGPGDTLFLDGEGEQYGAYVLNVTVTGTVGAGYVTVHPWPGEPPNASNLNYSPDVSVPNAVIVRTGPGMSFSNFGGFTHLIADVFGAFTAA